MSIAIASDVALGISQEERRRALAGDEGAFAWIVATFSSDMAQVCLVVVATWNWRMRPSLPPGQSPGARSAACAIRSASAPG